MNCGLPCGGVRDHIVANHPVLLGHILSHPAMEL